MNTIAATIDGSTDVHATSRPRKPARWARPALPIVLLSGAVLLPAVAGTYTVTLAATALVLAVLAVSTHLLVAVAGLPAFGQAAYFGVGGYTAALIAGAGVTVGPVLLAAAAITGAAAAALSAPLVLRTRGTAFLMVTFAVQFLTATAAGQWTTVGGDEGLHAPPVALWPAGSPLVTAPYVYWYTLTGLALAVAATTVVVRGRLGLLLRGCAGHEPRMAALGYRVNGVLAAGYIVAGAVAGAGGALLVAVNRYISPADLGFQTAAIALLCAAIGAGSITGTILGALAVVAARDWAGAATDGHGLALLGLLFLAVAYAHRAIAAARRHPNPAARLLRLLRDRRTS